MNRLSAILPAANVLVDVDATSKKRAFEQAGLLFENQHAIARATVADNLFARERLGSTGLGERVPRALGAPLGLLGAGALDEPRPLEPRDGVVEAPREPGHEVLARRDDEPVQVVRMSRTAREQCEDRERGRVPVRARQLVPRVHA